MTAVSDGPGPWSEPDHLTEVSTASLLRGFGSTRLAFEEVEHDTPEASERCRVRVLLRKEGSRCGTMLRVFVRKFVTLTVAKPGKWWNIWLA